MEKHETIATDYTIDWIEEIPEERRKYDAQAKAILSNTELMAYFLSLCFRDEFSGPIHEIAERLRKSLRETEFENKAGIRDNLTNTEDDHPEYGTVRFDYSAIALPRKEGTVPIIINFEVQAGKISPRTLSGRSHYNISRMMTREKNDVSAFSKTDYKHVLPVWGLWIIFNNGPTRIISVETDRKTIEVLIGDEHYSETDQLIQSLTRFNRMMFVYIGSDYEKYLGSSLIIEGISSFFMDRLSEEELKKFAYRKGLIMSGETINEIHNTIHRYAQFYNIEMQKKYDEAIEKMDGYADEIRRVSILAEENDRKARENECRAKENERQKEAILQLFRHSAKVTVQRLQNENRSVDQIRNELLQLYGDERAVNEILQDCDIRSDSE